MKATKGFLNNMENAFHSNCFQTKNNCFEIKVQRDFGASAQTWCLDKAQVSCRIIMSPEELCDYVINNTGGDGMKFV